MADLPRIFDRRLYAQRRAKARSSFVSADVAGNLAQRLGAVNRHFVSALDLSSRDDVFAAISPFAEHWTRTSLHAAGPLVADEECLPFAAETFDLVVSALSLHAVNDLPGALLQIRSVLKPDGLFLGALFGGATLSELRSALAFGESEVAGGASPRVAPMADVRELGGLLQRAGFALPVADAEKTLVRYRSFTTLVGDLRALGETNALSDRVRTFLRRDVVAAVLDAYAADNADAEGRLLATFEIVFLTGWAPHESQQKPLKPGAARIRLADALHTEERSAGERASPKPQDE
ncbi:MAG TPA: methyltransferase domain-containing protein [Rhizomicrobium sp.]|nr:methyltransferase domain-containing protein [Rhizomicrobium sp.]